MPGESFPAGEHRLPRLFLLPHPAFHVPRMSHGLERWSPPLVPSSTSAPTRRLFPFLSAAHRRRSGHTLSRQNETAKRQMAGVRSRARLIGVVRGHLRPPPCAIRQEPRKHVLEERIDRAWVYELIDLTIAPTTPRDLG